MVSVEQQFKNEDLGVCQNYKVKLKKHLWSGLCAHCELLQWILFKSKILSACSYIPLDLFYVRLAGYGLQSRRNYNIIYRKIIAVVINCYLKVD